MYVVFTVGLSHTGTLRRTLKWILNHSVLTAKKPDCAPRKFNFQCQIANFPQPFLLSKNQQRLWTADNILNGTSGEAKTLENICFCCWTKINSAELKAEERKAFRIQLTFCLLHKPVHVNWSRAGGWIRALLLCAVNTWPSLRGLCQFSGLDSWKGRSEIRGGTAIAIMSALVRWLRAIHHTQGRRSWTHPYCKREPSERQTRLTRGSTFAGGLLSWLAFGERRRPEQLQHLGIHVLLWTSEEYFHPLSPPPQLDLPWTPLFVTCEAFKGKLEKDAMTFLLAYRLWFRRFPDNFQDKVQLLERSEWTSYHFQKGVPKPALFRCLCWSCHWF